MPGIVLGSTSVHRRALLERLGIEFVCVAPDVDEAAVKQMELSPLQTAVELARRKAEAVHEQHPDAVVIGGDQLATVGGERLDKPGDHQRAVAQLRRLRGQEHLLVTAVAIAHPHGLVEFTDSTRLTMRELTDDEIERYVAREQPFDCAGSYRIESLGIALFDRVDSRDHTAIVGLPLIRLARELRKLGIAVP